MADTNRSAGIKTLCRILPAALVMACAEPPATTVEVRALPAVSDTIRPPVLYATGDYPFGNVTAAEPLDDDRVAVADYQSSQILIFSDEGALVETIGRDGDGPGELTGPSAITQLPDGALAVLSHQNKRVTVFSDGQDPVVTPVWLRGIGAGNNGRIGPGPVVYAWHFEGGAEPPEGRLVAAGRSRDVEIHTKYVTLSDHPGPVYRWMESGVEKVTGHPYFVASRHSINRHGDFAFLDADSTITIGNLDAGVWQKLALPDWGVVEQRDEVIDAFFERNGASRPPDFEKLPPITVTSIYIDDVGRLWLGRTAWGESRAGHEYTAVVVDPTTLRSTAVILPASIDFIPNGLFVRGDRAVVVTADSLGVEEVHVLDLSALPVAGPRS